jgi:hypothetical protein
MLLSDMLDATSPVIEEISTHLDRLDHSERLLQIRQLNKKRQKRLYEIAVAETSRLEDFVPSEAPRQREVIHHGKNSLPVLSHFQKRFCRSDSSEEELFGYNHNSTMSIVGPGYYVASSTEGNPEWEQRGGVVVDYYKLPDTGDVVDGWPSIKANSSGLQFFVYHKMRDFMRKVSSHVSIGIAYKGGKPIGQYFTLCRED